jgi:hypothetical protein
MEAWPAPRRMKTAVTAILVGTHHWRSGNFDVVCLAGQLHVDAPRLLHMSFRAFSYNGPFVRQHMRDKSGRLRGTRHGMTDLTGGRVLRGWMGDWIEVYPWLHASVADRGYGGLYGDELHAAGARAEDVAHRDSISRMDRHRHRRDRNPGHCPLR